MLQNEVLIGNPKNKRGWQTSLHNDQFVIRLSGLVSKGASGLHRQ
jgi:hypothetical protein